MYALNVIYVITLTTFVEISGPRDSIEQKARNEQHYKFADSDE